MTGEALQGIVDRWANEIYAHRGHGGLGGITPFARAATSTRPIRTVDADALATLLMQAPDAEGTRTVSKNGVRIGGFHYLTPDCLPGERVFVRLDPQDAGTAWLFDETGDRFIGRAINSQRAGVDPAELVAQTRAAQKAKIDADMAQVTRHARKTITQRTVLEARLKDAAAAAGNLVAFPPRSEIHSTPALDAGLEIAAIRRGEHLTPPRLDPVAQAQIEADLAPPEPSTVTPLRLSETPHQRFRRARQLEATLAEGGELQTDDAIWLGGYRKTAEYHAHSTIEADFGEAALR